MNNLVARTTSNLGASMVADPALKIRFLSENPRRAAPKAREELRGVGARAIDVAHRMGTVALTA